jgi:hypothetical protein
VDVIVGWSFHIDPVDQLEPARCGVSLRPSTADVFKYLTDRSVFNLLATARPAEGQLFQSQLFQSQLFQSQLFQSQLFQSQLFQSQLFQSQLFQSQLFQS